MQALAALFRGKFLAGLRQMLGAEELHLPDSELKSEGRSPKFRMMRAGLKLLGFDPETVMRHHQRRCILGMQLCPQARDFLLGKKTALPRHIEYPGEFRHATSRIVTFWRQRWLARRLDFSPALEALRKTSARKISERVPVESEPEPPANGAKPAPNVITGTGTNAAAVTFWRGVARATAFFHFVHGTHIRRFA